MDWAATRDVNAGSTKYLAAEEEWIVFYLEKELGKVCEC